MGANRFSAENQVRRLAVEAERSGQRLDNFLLGQLKGAPRSLIYRIVRTGQVRVNGKRAKPETRIAGGDQVRIPPVRLDATTDRARAPNTLLQQVQAAIVFEDRRILVLDKPSGIASHGGSGVSFGAIELLRQLRPNEALELAHRLDRDTSGVLVLAKKRSALTEMQSLIREGRLLKRYLALMLGAVGTSPFTVDAALEKSVLQGGERMVKIDAAGKPSVSHFKRLQAAGAHSYCEIRIETGRTHQIRVHAQHVGHPLAGDDKYGDRATNQALRSVGLKRLFLHATSLEFALDQGAAPYRLDVPLPGELQRVLDRLGHG